MIGSEPEFVTVAVAVASSPKITSLKSFIAMLERSDGTAFAHISSTATLVSRLGLSKVAGIVVVMRKRARRVPFCNGVMQMEIVRESNGAIVIMLSPTSLVKLKSPSFDEK